MPKTIPSTEQSYAIDDLDKKILRLLEGNAKLTVREIAGLVHLSPTPVHDRIKRLEGSGVIRQYATLLDRRKVNKPLLVICYVSLGQHSRTTGGSFIKAIQAMPEVLECLTISGSFDFLLKVATEDIDSYYDFHVNKLSALPNVSRVESSFVMGVVKETTALLGEV